MKTLFLATAALAIAGVVTEQSADTFTSRGLGYAAHNGRVELYRSAPVTIHWTTRGRQSSALVYKIDGSDGLQMAGATQQGMKEKAPVE